jgi:hypothetical protein
MAATARHTADISFRRLGSERLDHVPIHHRPNLTTFRSFGRYLRAPPNARPILSAFAISEAPSPCAFIARTWAASIEAGRPLYTPAALAWRSPRAGARGRPSLSFQSHTAAPVSRRWPGGRVGRAAWRAPTRRQPTKHCHCRTTGRRHNHAAGHRGRVQQSSTWQPAQVSRLLARM